ncbi:Uncharacterised protein [Serratia proteamaculans]|nr:Uncharacterised protein [Serratia proteamaculans]
MLLLVMRGKSPLSKLSIFATLLKAAISVLFTQNISAHLLYDKDSELIDLGQISNALTGQKT